MAQLNVIVIEYSTFVAEYSKFVPLLENLPYDNKQIFTLSIWT